MNKSAVLLLVGLCPLYANPIIPYEDVSLFGEKVEILCTRQSGYVKGIFTYAPSDRESLSQPVSDLTPKYLGSIFVPVFFPKDSMHAITSICNQDFLRNPHKQHPWDILVEARFLNVPLKVFNQYRLKDIYPLPKPPEVMPDWFSIPLNQIQEIRDQKRADAERNVYPSKIRRAFTLLSKGKSMAINISYRQPTYMTNNQTCFIYTPIIPTMINQQNYSITIKCRSRFILALITKNETAVSSDTCITVVPLHLEPIIVSISER